LLHYGVLVALRRSFSDQAGNPRLFLPNSTSKNTWRSPSPPCIP